MSEIYIITKTSRTMTNLESHLLVRKNNLLNHAKDIVLYLYPYRVFCQQKLFSEPNMKI